MARIHIVTLVILIVVNHASDCLNGQLFHRQASNAGIELIQPHERRQVTGPVLYESTTVRQSQLLNNDFLFSVQVNTDSNGDNISGDAANEPSIALDPTNEMRCVIGWRQFDSVQSNFRQAGVSYSRDGGSTWVSRPPIDKGIFRTDPVLRANSEGDFFYYSLTIMNGNFSCELFTSTDGGANWTGPIPGWGGDRQWIAIDRTNGIGAGNIYAFWSPIASCCPGFFTRSFDGKEFTLPLPLATPLLIGSNSVGPDGALYFAGLDIPSLDQAAVVRSDDAQDPDTQFPTFPIAQIVDLDGTALPFSSPGSPNPGGFLSHYDIETDHSHGPTRGNVYLLASVDPENSDPSDVMFSKSVDRGETWSQPIRINSDSAETGKYNWFGTMSVAPNGRIDAIWNDMRDDPGQNLSAMYYSFSIDGGETWSENVRVTDQFDSLIGQPQQNKIGDYYDMYSTNSAVHVAFAATFNGEQDIFYLRIDAEKLIPMGDANCDGATDLLDVGPFVELIANGRKYLLKVDFNGDGQVDALDIEGFVSAITR